LIWFCSSIPHDREGTEKFCPAVFRAKVQEGTVRQTGLEAVLRENPPYGILEREQET
jgi:hypothetical protein